MDVAEYFLAGIGLGAVLLALGYALLWVAVLVAFACGEIADWIRSKVASR